MKLSYWDASQNIVYSILLIVPIFIIYESLYFLDSSQSIYQIRNGADVIFKNFFHIFGSYSRIVFKLSLLTILIIILYFNYSTIFENKLKLSFLFYMLIESILWSLVLLFTIYMYNNTVILSINNYFILNQYHMAIGAGIWEEILFRLCLIPFMIFIFKYLFSCNILLSTIISLVLSSTLFSLFHYIGPFADLFTYHTFILRLMAGLILGILYVMRGLGIAIYTHTIYNIIIISTPYLLFNFIH